MGGNAGKGVGKNEKRKCQKMWVGDNVFYSNVYFAFWTLDISFLEMGKM